MLAEFVKSLADLKASAMAAVAVPSNDPRVERFSIGGTLQTFNLTIAPRDHAPATLDDLIRIANRFVVGGYKPAVWYDRFEVVLVIDDDGHRVERATLFLESSDVFLTAISLRSSRTWWDQKAFIRLLKIDLAGTLPPAVLLDRVRKLSVGTQTSSEVLRAKESLGRTTVATTGGEGEIPEAVSLNIQVYKTPGEGETFWLPCSVELDPTRQDCFRLMPLPDQIERLVDQAVRSIGERLATGLDEAVPAYYGRPKR